MQVETRALAFASGREVVSHAREVRAKLMGSAPAPLPPQIAAPPEPIAAPTAPNPVSEIIEAVCAAVGVTREDLFSATADGRAQAARKIAIALVVIRLRVPREVVAEHFGVVEGAVEVALRRVLAIFAVLALPVGARLPDVVEQLADNWQGSLPPPAPRATVAEIKRVVACEFGVTVAELECPGRSLNIVRPRQVAMALARLLAGKTMPYIGSQFGGRDHSTVHHAIRKMRPLFDAVAAKMSREATIDEWVAAMARPEASAA